MGRVHVPSLLALVVLASGSASCAGLLDSPWPGFRHDALHTGRSTSAGPTSGNVAWSRDIGGTGKASPAIGNGRVYAVGNGTLAAVSESGEILWTAPCGNTDQSSPSIASDGTVYVGSTDGYLYAFNPDGTLRWKRSAGALIKASPTIGPDGSIYIGSNGGKFTAFRSDGSTKYTFTVSPARPISSSAAVGSDGTAYFGCDDGYLYAVGPTGAQKWRFATDANSPVRTSPTIGPDGTIYFGAVSGFFYAVNPSGTIRYRYTAGGPLSSPAIGADGTVYFGCSDGYLYCLLPGTNLLRWRTHTGAWIDSSPAIDANGKVFVGSNNGSVYAIDPDGGIAWSTSAGTAVTASPAIGVDCVYINTTDGSLCCIKTDVTPPPPPQVIDDGDFTANPSELHASWSCADPESGIAGYEYAIRDSAGHDVVAFTDAGSATEVTCSGLQLATGEHYYFAVRAVNGAGLWSEVGLSDGILVDATPPIVTDLSLAPSLREIRARVTATDAESGVSLVQVALLTSPQLPDTPNWISGAPNADIVIPGPLDPAAVYYVAARAVNRVGLTSAATISSALRLDDTPPTVPIVTDDGAYTSDATSLHASWASQDAESGIDHYSYCVGTSTGTADVVAWTDTTATSSALTGLSLTSGSTYYFSVKAINRAGLISTTGTSDGITVDTSAPVTTAVNVGVSVQEMRARVSATDAESGISEVQCALLTSPELPASPNWISASPDQDVVIPGPFSITSVYYVAARSRNGAGLWGPAIVSGELRVDGTPPSTPVVTDDGAYSTSASSLHASWASEDPESGIGHYSYCVGTSVGSANVVPWTDTDATSAIIDGLSLVSGNTYYISVKATNRAGLASGVGSSDGILIDLTPPAVMGLNLTATVQSVRAKVSATDSESGVNQVQVALLTSPELPASPNWISGSPDTDIVIPGPLDPANLYYVAARATNRAGLISEVTISSAVRLDNTPPTTPVVTDDGVYTSDATSLHASWVSQDAESGIDHYSYCVGTSVGSSNVVPWTDTGATSKTVTGLSLTNGATYYFSVKATNRAGLTSSVGVSNGITVDNTPPITPVVTDDGDFTTSSECLHVMVSCSDPESGLASYSYCVGTTPGAADIVPYTSAGLNPSITVCGLNLQAGTNYYISVRATNGAGLQSPAGTSDGITYRLGTCAWRKFRSDIRNTGRADVQAPMTGRLQWRMQTQGYIESSAAVGSDGTIYIGSGDGKLYAITPAGTVRWSYDTGTSVDSSPAIGPDGCIYVGSYDGLHCLRPSGALNWKYTTSGMVWSSPSVGEDGTVYFGCQDHRFYAVNPDGTIKWTYLAGGAIWSSPAISSDGSICFACGDGKLYSLTPQGALRWSYQTGSAADSSPAIGEDDVVYFGSGDGYLYAIWPNGARKWRLYLGQVVDSSVALTADGRIYVGTGGAGTAGTLYAITTSGQMLWHVDLTGGLKSSPAVDEHGNICIGCGNGRLYLFTRDGSILWSYSTGDSILSSPAYTAGGGVVVGSDDGGIYYFRDQDSSDKTPPTTPVVHIGQQFITADKPISAWWSSADPESGIRSYSYAIGTGPGLDDVVSWTDVGTDTSVSRSGIPPIPGATYYVSVIATNHALMPSEPGVSGPITVVSGAPANTIGGAKKRLIGTQVNLPGKVVTAVFSDCVFVEEPDRSSAIRCLTSSPGALRPGNVVNVTGSIGLRYGETMLSGCSIAPAGFDGNVRAVGMPSETLFKVGLDVSGMLIRAAGKVVRVGTGYFVLYDGCHALAPHGGMGVEVQLPAGVALPTVDSYVSVEGIACHELVGSRVSVVIRIVPGSEMKVYP